jgi:hypothetical protein
MIFRIYHETAGGHVHCQVFAGRHDGALGKCGDLCMRVEEFEIFKPAATFIQFLEKGREALPAPAQVANTAREAIARRLAKWIGYLWDGLHDYSVVDKGYPEWVHFGTIPYQGGKQDLFRLADELIAISAPPQAGSTSGTELGRWCYENPNVAARTIEGLRAALAEPQGAASTD